MFQDYEKVDSNRSSEQIKTVSQKFGGDGKCYMQDDIYPVEYEKSIPLKPICVPFELNIISCIERNFCIWQSANMMPFYAID